MVTLVKTADLQKQTLIHLDDVKKNHKTTLNKVLLEKKAIEDQVAILNKSLKKAKATRDKAILASESLKFEQERLSRMAKEEAEEILKAEAQKETVIKALKEERADRGAVEEWIKKEAYELAREDATQEIFQCGMSFRLSALFMIRRSFFRKATMYMCAVIQKTVFQKDFEY